MNKTQVPNNMETLIEFLDNQQEEIIYSSFLPELEEPPILDDRTYNEIRRETNRTVYGYQEETDISVRADLKNEAFLMFLKEKTNQDNQLVLKKGRRK